MNAIVNGDPDALERVLRKRYGCPDLSTSLIDGAPLAVCAAQYVILREQGEKHKTEADVDADDARARMAARKEAREARAKRAASLTGGAKDALSGATVSYTHLTLPTICSV